MTDRYIGENINRILSIMDHAYKNNLEAMLIFIDFETAFDCIEWEFIIKTLEYFNFNDRIINWVKILYKDSSTFIQNNGWTSDNFKLGRGVRQGCPLSPYLFILCVEILAMNIRYNKEIKGIQINEEEFKINQYADDTSLSLLYCETSLAEALSTFNSFKLESGLKINIDKTDIMRIGPIKHTNCRLLPEIDIKWTNTPIKVLRIWIAADHTELMEINFNPKLGRIKQNLNIWSQRKLTFLGKITLIKTFAMSQLIYLLSVLPTPTNEY